MNDITLCTMHTEKPYYIKEINKNIYSIEELSYYLFNYLYLIDDQFFSEGLIDYIENELKQPHIASGIRQINANKGALGEKISFLIKNAGYYTEREAEKLENNLGVAYARLFEYDQAATAFRCAYRLNASAESLESIIMCDLITDNEKRLKMDKDKYGVSDTVINRIKTEIIKLNAEIKTGWNKKQEDQYMQQCKKEYIVEINS